jgi:hypothetical protein
MAPLPQTRSTSAEDISTRCRRTIRLVYDAGFLDYLAFLCGVGAICVGVPPIDPSDLNLASIGIAELAGMQTVTRTVMNVGDDATYAVSGFAARRECGG